jgi:4-amino-4-deoxy-L-arabinose transferase-like glycosyltransferase
MERSRIVTVVRPETATAASTPTPSAQDGQAPVAAARAARPDRVPALAWVIAAAFVALELAVSGRYGFTQDELYFIEAGRHLALGYVDQPPLMPLLDKITDLLGVNPTAIRIIPALAGGALVVAAARFAALFGADRFGRVLAALATACAPALIGATHLGNTTPVELLAWTVVLLCITTALLRHRPRWWLGAGVAAGVGLEDNNLLIMLLIAVVIGLALSAHRDVLRTRWPWLGSGIAAAIWAPNLAWQATHGWPQLAMAAVLHQENSSTADYLGGPVAQLLYVGLLATPLLIGGFRLLWRTPELRFIAITVALVVGYVLAWVPGRPYYTDGLAPVVLAAGSVAAQGWITRARRPRLTRGAIATAPLFAMVMILPLLLPLLPVGDMHALPPSIQQNSAMGDTVGFPQLARAVAARDAALARRGEAPTSIFTGYYAEAATLDVLGSADHLPPVLSGNNAYWMWGPGRASDRTVLVVDALAELRPDFAACRLLTTYRAPYHVRNDWTDIGIGVCTGPHANWPALWPRLRQYS